MKKIKVGFDISPLYSGDKIRGVGFYTQRLLAEIKKIEGIKIVEVKSKDDRKKANYDLLHIPYFRPFSPTLSFKKHTPWIVTVHDLIPIKYPEHYPPGVKGKIFWQWQKMHLRKADLIITDSFASKYDIARLVNYPQDKIYTIYLAADSIFKPIKNKKVLAAVRAKYQLPTKFVLYVGDVNWNKNIPGLVKACRELKVPLVVVGKQATAQHFDIHHPENKDLVWLQQQAKKSKLIRLLGFVPTKDLAAIYNLAAVYCQPSFDEGFGLSVIEAMASGCPVIAARRGSLPEVVGEAGILVEPEAESIAAGIKRILQSSQLAEKLERLGRYQSRQFSWHKAAKATAEVYEIAVQY